MRLGREISGRRGSSFAVGDRIRVDAHPVRVFPVLDAVTVGSLAALGRRCSGQHECSGRGLCCGCPMAACAVSVRVGGPGKSKASAEAPKRKGAHPGGHDSLSASSDARRAVGLTPDP